MTDPIDLGAERARRADYVDTARIAAVVHEIRACAEIIAQASVETHGAMDVLAHELTALANAIDRLMADVNREPEDAGL